MFGDNQKISGRQLERMLVLDWVGKTGLLIPGSSGSFGGTPFLFRLLLGIGLTLVYTWLIAQLSKKVENDFYGYVCFRLGKTTAIFISLIYWIYSFVSALLLLKMFASIAVTFVLPETRDWMLIVIAALGGVYAAAGGLEVRARFSEALYPVIIVPLIFLLLFGVTLVHPGYLIPEQSGTVTELFAGGTKIFSVFGGLGLFLYVAPEIDNKRRASKAMFRSVSAILAGTLLLFVMVVGTFGEQGMKALPWPLLTLMSSVEIPGGFLQRWDVIFTALMLGSLFAAIASNMYYLGLLTGKMFGGKKRKANLCVPAIMVTVSACICGGYRAAAQLYTNYNSYIYLPLAVLVTCVLLLPEWKGKRRKQR